ncbi:MAG: RsmE family RNA methyltransferase [Phycisphaerales bacterium]
MGVHRVHFDTPFATLPGSGESLTVSGDEAHHALSVKRLNPGDRVEVLDGAGAVIECLLAGATAGKRAALTLTVVGARRVAAVAPRLTVASAVPKGGRLDDMISQLAQLGAAAWRPLLTVRGAVRPADLRVDRLARVAFEASKQCGRAHALVLGEPLKVEAVAERARAGECVMVADAAGGSIPSPCPAALTVLVGPEGGFDPDESAMLRGAGVASLRLGPHVLRIETAAVAAAALLLCGAG